MSREDSRHRGRVGRRTGLLKCSSYLMLQDTDCWKLNVICAVSWSGMNAQPILATNICLGSTIDECSRLLRGSRPEKALWAMAGGDPEHHQHGGQVLLAPWCIFDFEFHHRLILGDTFNATSLRQTAKEMLLANSKKLDLIPDWRKKLSTRTELTLEVLGELARNSLWSRDILVLWQFGTSSPDLFLAMYPVICHSAVTTDYCSSLISSFCFDYSTSIYWCFSSNMLHLVMIGDTIISKHCIISLLNKLTQKAGQWQGYARGQHLYHMYSTTYSLNLNWVFYVLIQTNNWPIYHCKHIYKVHV